MPGRLGANLTLRVANAKGSTGVLVVGTKLPLRPTDLGRGCALYFDVLQPTLPVAFTPDAAGGWSTVLAVPNVPALDGLLLPLPAGVGPTATAPLGTDLTSGLLLAVRK